MATSYTSLLGFALPVTGELQGTWGDTVNNSITQLCEDSIAGVATASVLSSDWTLTTTGAGAANQARMAILIPTGSPGVSRNIIAPSKSKTYTVINQSNAAVVIKGAATTGVSVASGDTVIVAWNGSDFVAVKNADGAFTNLSYTGTLTGSTGVMNIGSGQLYKDASGNVGIGTISPITKLDVAGNGRFISTNSGATTSGAVTIRDYATNNSTGYVQWVDNANTMQLGAIGGIAGAGGGLKFQNGTTEAMRIDASGKLMLGTTVSGISRFNLVSDINYGGAGYSQLITLTNSIAGTTNPNKFIRLSGTGDLEIVNSAYTSVLVGMDDTGVFTSYKTFSGNSTQSGNQFQSIYPGIRSYGFGTTSDYAFAIKDLDAGSERLRIDPSGNLLVGATSGSYKITCNGQPGANGYTAWTNYSDERLKENVVDFKGGLAEILMLKPKSFNYNKLSGYDEETRARTVSGFIAQELQLVCPEMVGTIKIDGVDYLDTNTSNLNLLLVKAIQEQQAIIESLTTRLEALEAK